MSSGSSCSQTPSRAIPTTRRVVLGDGVQLPPGDYSTTPGGTLFSTTPGGTRIIYDRKFLMECRNSPVTKTPPRDLPTIPGVTSPVGDEPPTDASQNHLRSVGRGVGCPSPLLPHSGHLLPLLHEHQQIPPCASTPAGAVTPRGVTSGTPCSPGPARGLGGALLNGPLALPASSWGGVCPPLP
uniref:Eukaryotic translation initiation factor 4E binding protein 1 n=2 Tax=Sus scrofa TaxID=9823 RepID=A0A8D1EBC6_PIG